MPSLLFPVLPGAGRRRALSRLLTVEDLPPGWRRDGQRTWRTGRTGQASPWRERARQNGSVTAWRSFRGGKRWLWAQAVPLATRDDAVAALRTVGECLLANPAAAVEVVGERDVDLPLFGDASAVWAREQQVRSVATGHNTVTLLLAGAVGSDVLVLSLSGEPAWDWDDATDLASRQAARLTATAG
ncbi:hypothetical protein [Streptomyces sp. TRM68367]|uniref:hypothetical protein n=1 Tax=Streptomyces sp. TRM68367 TaxID=2758415 RepID=UPI00165B0E6E|nr:hypothetical protein [Streptomyces sp. TRM68367]MBC9731573.1 hypothetical protein [Streptomyces sp. TRM68367]